MFPKSCGRCSNMFRSLQMWIKTESLFNSFSISFRSVLYLLNETTIKELDGIKVKAGIFRVQFSITYRSASWVARQLQPFPKTLACVKNVIFTNQDWNNEGAASRCSLNSSQGPRFCIHLIHSSYLSQSALIYAHWSGISHSASIQLVYVLQKFHYIHWSRSMNTLIRNSLTRTSPCRPISTPW